MARVYVEKGTTIEFGHGKMMFAGGKDYEVRQDIADKLKAKMAPEEPQATLKERQTDQEEKAWASTEPMPVMHLEDDEDDQPEDEDE